MRNTTIHIGGVPEHFNLPIHLAIEEGDFSQKGLDIQWTTFKGGTGQMTKALREDTVDACILLTEGIIKDILQGNPSKIISNYVTSPLIWGVHTSVENPLYRYRDIFDKNYAISRFGSGSHLMAIVDADSKEQKIDESQFKIIRNLEGALESLAKQETDVFLLGKIHHQTLCRCWTFEAHWRISHALVLFCDCSYGQNPETTSASNR